MPSFPYAQTNIQLFNQLQREGYSDAELALVRNAYELTVDLHTGRFLASGRTHIAHVVGTASILGSPHPPADVVAAGLIHNVYGSGEFGCGSKGISRAKRKRVRQIVGEQVEEYVYRFLALRLNPRTLSIIGNDPDALDSTDRHAFLIELAERLDHHLSHDGLEKYQKHMDRSGQLMVGIAEKLGFADLAAEMQKALTDRNPGKVFVRPIDPSSPNRSRVVAPRSYRRRLRVACRQEVVREFRYLRSTIGMRRRLGRLVRWFRGLCFPKQA